MHDFFTSADLMQLKNAENPVSSGKNSDVEGGRIRVVRIAHASLTPALRGRERALAQRFPILTSKSSRLRVGVKRELKLKPCRTNFSPSERREHFCQNNTTFCLRSVPIIEAFRRHQPHIIDMDHEPYSVPCAEILTLRNWFAPQAKIVMQTAQNILKNYPPPFSIGKTRVKTSFRGLYVQRNGARSFETKGFDKPIQIAPFGVDLEMFKPKTPEQR